MEQRESRHFNRIWLALLGILLTLIVQLVIFSFRYGQLTQMVKEDTARIQRIEKDVYVVKQNTQ